VLSMALGPDGSVALRLSSAGLEGPGTLEVWAPTPDGEARRTGSVTYDSDVPFDTILGFGPAPGTLVIEDDPADGNQPSRVLSVDIAGGAVTTIADDLDALGNTLAADGILVMCHRRDEPQADEVSRLDLRDGAESTVALPAGARCSLDGPVIDAGATMLAADFDVVVDLRTGQPVGQPRAPLDQAVLHGPLVTEGDRLLALHADANAILMSEVPTDGRALPAERGGASDDSMSGLTELPGVHTVRVLPDGEHLLGVSSDDARLLVMSADGHNELIASVDRPPPALRPPSPVGPSFNDDGTLVVDRVAPDRIEVRRLPGLEPVSEMTIATAADEGGAADPTANVVRWSFDRFFTYDGPVAQWWDPASGELVAELDLRDTGLLGDAPAGSFFLASYVDPDHVVLTVVGDPEAHILEVATGRQVGVLPFGDDVLATKFQPDSRYVTILRQGDLLEMWDRVEARRVLGPFPSLGALNDTAGDVIIQFLPEPGRYLLGDREQLRWYEAGGAAPTRRLDLGTDRLPVSASRDGSVVLYIDARIEPVFMPPLHIDPVLWQQRLCDIVDDRAFSPEEHAQLPAGTPSHPCL